jgi:iron complex outermembrane recepter protein
MRRLLMSAGSVLALVSPGFAHAEAAAPTEVQELIVTGEKTTRSLQETVASVAVVTAERIEQENLKSFFDVVALTANVAATYGPSGFSIRGIDNASVSGGGTGALATVYLDGAPLPDKGLAAGPLETWDLSQIEILRGPQSTLQGRNALAGAVTITTADPTWDWGLKVRVRATDEEERAFAFAGGGPLVDDQLAFRIAAEVRESDGFIRNTTRREQEDDVSAKSVRVKLLTTPDALPGFTGRLSWLHDEREAGYVYTYARTDVAEPFDNRISTGDFPATSDNITDIVTGRVDYALNARMDLTGIASWTRVDNVSTYDGDATPQPFSWAVQDELDETFTQELRLSYRGERLEGLLGAYHSSRENDYSVVTLTRVRTPESALVDILVSRGAPPAAARQAARLYVAALPFIPVNFVGRGPLEIETFALFGDGRLHLTPKLSLLAGFRYDRESNSNGGVQSATFAGTFPNPAAYSPLAPLIAGLNLGVAAYVADANALAAPEDRTFEAFLPKLGLRYELTDDASASFVVQRGYRSGGSTVNLARSSVVAYDPEFTWNYEAAFRSVWLDNRLTVNANAYYIDWTDQQVSVNLGRNMYDYQTENAGSSHAYGFELETTWRADDRLGLYGSVGYARTKFDDFAVSVGEVDADLSGAEFRFAPHWTLAGGANYRFTDRIVGNVNAAYRSQAYSDPGPLQALSRLDARTVVNARLAYETERWTASVFADNLFDEHYFQYIQPTMSRAILGKPQVLGAVLEARW